MKNLFSILILLLIFQTVKGAAPVNYPSRTHLFMQLGTFNISSSPKTIKGFTINRDLRSKRKMFVNYGIGLMWAHYSEIFSLDTNYVVIPATKPNHGDNSHRNYYYKYQLAELHYSISCKYRIIQNKKYQLYASAGLDLVSFLKEKVTTIYYYRDLNQVLHLGPYYSSNSRHKGDPILIPDRISPKIEFGYLKKINENFDIGTSFSLAVLNKSMYYQTPSKYQIKLCAGITYHIER